MRAGPYHPKYDFFFGWARAVVFHITNVPNSHSGEVPGGSIPGILPVYSVNSKIPCTNPPGISPLCESGNFVIWNTTARAQPKTTLGVLRSRAHQLMGLAGI